jgi:dTDP-glucose 4,6-dehydratase/UDP-glucuronate decarboxylase
MPKDSWRFIKCDVNIYSDIAEIMMTYHFDYVFHYAAMVGVQRTQKHPVGVLEDLHGIENVLKLCKNSGVKRIYFSSSSEVYGDPSVSPQSEDYFGNVNPNGIRSVYDEGKRFGEAITASYVREYGLDARIIRVFNTYGPMMQIDDGRVVSNFINQAILNKPITIYGDGSQTRSFCYIDDMVEGLMLAMFSDKTKGEVINLGNPDERKISELATIIKDITSSQSDIVFEDLPEDDPKIRKPDISKAEKLLDWSPKVDIEQGIRKTVEYFKSISI